MLPDCLFGSQLPPRRVLAAAISLTLATALPTATRAEEAKPQQLPKVSVQTDELNEYQAEKASSPKYTEPLRDTPQSISVVTRQVIEDQNLLSLRDILSTVPGITFGAGEGGGGYGDSINLRGFNGNNDITVDGVRDSAQYTRSDPFNLEQVEVINGANSVYSGAGAVGGTINLASKTAQLDSFSTVSAGVGTDSYGRLTLDSNQKLGDSSAVRINMMGHKNEVPDRDYEENERWGIAPSVAFGLGTDTTFSLSYLHQKDDNTPQYGVPTFRGRLLPGASYERYYGYHNVDTQEIDVDIVTATLQHTFSDSLSVRNLTRWQEVDQLSIVDPPQGTYCLASTGLTPAGAACGAVPAGFYQPSGPRGNVRDTTNSIIINQTDFTKAFNTGSVEHTLVAGLSISREEYDLTGGNVLRNADGATPNPVLPVMNIADPDSLYTGPRNFIRTSSSEGELDNQAIYVFDTIKFSERWQLSAGVRYEDNDGSSQSTSYATPASGGAVTVNPRAGNADKLLSYRAGLVFKPVENGSIYLAYGNSETPSRASVNGSCTLTSTTGTANCTIDPEEAVNYELGVKWDLFDARIQTSAAIFRNERTNYRVNDPGNPDNPSGQQQLDGEARVDGLLLSLNGRITDNWAVVASYTYLDSEVIQGASDFISSRGQDYTKGDSLTNVPENAFDLWTAYDLPYRIQVGYGVTFQDEVYVTQHNANNPNGPLYTAPSYVVHRAMVSYGVSRNLSLQLNANNLFDKEYLTRVRTQEQAWATPGAGRSLVLNASYSF